MDSHKDVGLVMPKVFYPNGDFQYLCKLLPTPYDIFLRQFASKSLKDRNDDKYAMKTANFDIEMDVPSLSGCFMFFRSECFNRINGLILDSLCILKILILQEELEKLQEPYFFLVHL